MEQSFLTPVRRSLFLRSGGLSKKLFVRKSFSQGKNNATAKNVQIFSQALFTEQFLHFMGHKYGSLLLCSNRRKRKPTVGEHPKCVP